MANHESCGRRMRAAATVALEPVYNQKNKTTARAVGHQFGARI